MEPKRIDVLKEMLVESMKAEIGLEIAILIKKRMCLRLITPASESLRQKMERQIAVDENTLTEQKKVVEVIKELIKDEEKEK